MKQLLGFLVRTRAQAVVGASAGLLIPPFSFITGGIVGLAVLRHGAAEGSLVLAGAIALAGAVTWVLLHSVTPVLVFTVLTGLPVLALAVVLRVSASQGITLAAAAVLGALAILVIHLLTGDPMLWWREVLEQLLFAGSAAPEPAAAEQTGRVIDLMAAMMTSLPAGVAVAATLVVFLARWWHAILDNPGGFGQEFRGLRLHPRMAPPAIAAVVLGLSFRDALGGLWPAIGELMVMVYGLQGIAVAHAIAVARATPVGWLVTMYLLVAILPSYALTALAVAGVSDTWMDYRKRWSPGS